MDREEGENLYGDHSSLDGEPRFSSWDDVVLHLYESHGLVVIDAVRWRSSVPGKATDEFNVLTRGELILCKFCDTRVVGGFPAYAKHAREAHGRRPCTRLICAHFETGRVRFVNVLPEESRLGSSDVDV